jgi:uncharacterized protein YecE (DUF72 family)
MNLQNGKYRIGTAGWSIPGTHKEYFPQEGTHLEKYAQVFNAVEINSCFYREHKPETYRRWADAVPEDFSFSLKLLKYFTHEKRLTETGDSLVKIIEGHQNLGRKWGSFLIQLPPSLAFAEATVARFLGDLRRLYAGPLFCEPRHLSWTTAPALKVLQDFDVSKVFADPEPCALPPGHSGGHQVYLRLHGTPEIYKSSYSPLALREFQQKLKACGNPSQDRWCIFDNTTFGFSINNALELKRLCLPHEAAVHAGLGHLDT